MEFEYFNSNPDATSFKSGKPKAWNRDDSSVRAISVATGLDWDSSYAELDKIAMKQHDMINSKNVINEFCILHNFEHKTYGKPEVGTKRPNVEEFVDEHKEGTYILYLRDYFVTIKDGCQYNTVKLTKDSVYSYWVLK